MRAEFAPAQFRNTTLPHFSAEMFPIFSHIAFTFP